MLIVRRLLLTAVLAVVLLVAALAIEHYSGVSLSTPTGPFAVGRTLFDWADTARQAGAAGARPATPRELLVWVWYPAAEQPGAAFDSYIPAALRMPPPPRDLRTLLTHDAAHVRGHSLANAAVSPKRRSYPVAVIGAGATSRIVNYSTLAEDLASHGYVVVGFDSAYRTSVVAFPDGRVIMEAPENNPELASEKDLPFVGDRLMGAALADTEFLLARLEQLNRSTGSPFAGRLDLTRLGVFGHSLGGSTALQFCQEDARCKAGIDIDGRPMGTVVETGLRKPFLFILSDHSRDPNPATRRSLANVRSVYARLPADKRGFVVIQGADHLTFSDEGAVRKSWPFGIGGRRRLALTTSYVSSFFDRYL